MKRLAAIVFAVLLLAACGGSSRLSKSQYEQHLQDGGKAEAAYRSDPLGRVVLGSIAAATGGRAFEEGGVGGADAYLRRAAGTGPVSVIRSTTVTRQPLAPYLAAAGLLLLALCFAHVRVIASWVR